MRRAETLREQLASLEQQLIEARRQNASLQASLLRAHEETLEARAETGRYAVLLAEARERLAARGD